MHLSAKISIPRRLPTLLFQSSLPTAYPGMCDYPALLDDLLLFVCGGSSPPEESPERMPVLVALDRWNGRERFRVAVPINCRSGEIATCMAPTIRADGIILLAVYQKDVSLSVLAINRDGTILWEDQLGHEDGQDKKIAYKIAAFDLYIKHWFSPVIPGPEESYLLSWLYRMREAHMVYRQPGAQRSTWHASEWLYGYNSTTVFGNTIVRRAAEADQEELLVARDLISGEIRWSRPSGQYLLADVTDQMLLVIARPPTFSRKLEGESYRLKILRNFVSDAVEEEGEEEPLQPSLFALKAETGEELWSLDIAADVEALGVGPDHVCLIGKKSPAQHLFFCLDKDGRVLWSQELDSTSTNLAILAVDALHVLWEDGETLVCTSLDQGKTIWQLDIPETGVSEQARVQDRIFSKLNGVVADSVIYLRGNHLRAYTDRSL